MNSDWKKNGEFIHTRNPASRASKPARLVAMYIAVPIEPRVLLIQ